MNKIFDGVAGNHPALNRFDCSYTQTFSAKIGLLYVAGCDEVVPGDVFKMSAFCHAEVMPMVAPLMSDLTIFAHTFFVPYRIIYGVDNSDGQPLWEKFITGGKDGDYDTPLPAWNPNFTVKGFSSGTIWDSMCFPMAYDTEEGEWTPIVPGGLSVSSAPKRSYNKIFNDWYRDENLVEEVDLDNEYLLHPAFKKDYFTSALEQQQRGVSPAIEVLGTIPVTLSGQGFAPLYYSTEAVPFADTVNHRFYRMGSSSEEHPYSFGYKTGMSGDKVALKYSDGSGANISDLESNVFNPLGVNVSGLSGTATASGQLTAVNINTLRLMFAQQRLLELNERAGYRYTEFLSAHYGVSPTDARLDRPEYIGGCLVPINVSVNVSSVASATTPQGNKVATANANSVQKIGNYRVLEHGLIMTLISIRPKPIYQQGVDRQWLRQSRFDYYTPEFAYLSESGIYNAELYCDGTTETPLQKGDNGIFGYQACWNELRCKQNRVGGAVREQLDYYTLARKFGSRPALNQDFIEIRDEEFNRVFAVQDEDEFVVAWSNIIDAYRPLPAMGIPGLVDHVYGGR